MKFFYTIVVIFFVAGIICCNSSKKIVADQNRPNIIFLLADDLRYDALGCTGNKIAITPNLDALAQKGSNLKHAYVTTAICAISRASYLSGQYERRHRIDDFAKSFSDSALQQTYPLLLRSHGYYTGFIGKYGVGNSMPVNAFDYWKGFPGHGSYFYKQADGTMIHETALMGKQMQEFINNRNISKPFCLSVSFKAPHSEDGIKENNGFRPDPFFNDWYLHTVFPKPFTYADSFYYLFPEQWRKDVWNKENEARVRFNDRFSTDEKFQTTVRAVYRLVSGIDKVVGELMDYLKQSGLDKNTIIIFTSDNGYYMGEHGLEGKWYGHQESIHVPLIVYNPFLKQQRKEIEEPVLNIDLAPTILKWANLTAPASMQGQSYASLLTGKSGKWRTEFFYEHRYDAGSYPVYIPHTVGVVSPTYKYMRYYNEAESKNYIYEELFDFVKDRFETNNLAESPLHQQTKERFKKMVTIYENKLQ